MEPNEETYDLYQKGWTHLKRGDNAQATVPLEKAKRREPDKASIREALGLAYLRLGRYGEAEAEFEHILAVHPANHYAHYCLGRCLEGRGQRGRALGHYKMADILRPGVDYYRRAMERLRDRA